MKLWQKIFLGSFVTSVVLFLLCGFIIVVTDLHYTLEEEIARTERYQEIYEEKAPPIFGAGRTDKVLFRYLVGFRETLASDGRYIHLKIDGELVYDTFRKFPPEPRYTTYNDGAAAFTPSYMKDIEDSRYLYQSDAFVWNNRSYGFTLIKDLSQIYASCNRQLTLLFSLCMLQGLLLAVVMFLVSKGITAPIERLNRAAQLLAKESIAIRLPVEGEDEISELSENFNYMAQEISRSIEDYKQMVGNLTHEIKTPLTSIIGYAELLQDERCGEALRRQALEYIVGEGRRLHSITRKIVHLSRIRPELLSMERHDVRPLLETALMATGPKAKGKGVEVRCCGGQGVYCYADRELLITTLENVLDNAIKASCEGGVVEVEATGKQGALKSITVTDHGVGISPEELKKIDQPFYTADKSRSRSEDGLGLGLSICKAVMQCHGGEISFSSELGVYTRVELSFPAARYRAMESGVRQAEAVDTPSAAWDYNLLRLLN